MVKVTNRSTNGTLHRATDQHSSARWNATPLCNVQSPVESGDQSARRPYSAADQVEKARAYSKAQSLRPGSPAYSMFHEMLDAFCEAAKLPGTGAVRRAETLAKRRLKQKLGDTIVSQQDAVAHGSRIANKALHWAHVELSKAS